MILGGAQITTDALAACVDQNVRVASLKRGGGIRFVVGGPVGGNVHLRTALHEAVADPERSLALSRVIIAGKLQNSRQVVRRWARDNSDNAVAEDLRARAEQIAGRIGRLATAPSPDHVRGIEGDAARIYFGAMKRVLANSCITFASRTRRPPRDPVNALLGYCYGLLVTELIGALDSVGLDHQLGVFHRPRSGRPSLALDLAEEFRPVIDRTVVTLIRRRQVGLESFVRTPGGAVYLEDEARVELLKVWETQKEVEYFHPLLRQPVERWALPSIQATLLARHLRGDIPTYPPFLLRH